MINMSVVTCDAGIIFTWDMQMVCSTYRTCKKKRHTIRDKPVKEVKFIYIMFVERSECVISVRLFKGKDMLIIICAVSGLSANNRFLYAIKGYKITPRSKTLFVRLLTLVRLYAAEKSPRNITCFQPFTTDNRMSVATSHKYVYILC
jgi:hypothetical protein